MLSPCPVPFLPRLPLVKTTLDFQIHSFWGECSPPRLHLSLHSSCVISTICIYSVVMAYEGPGLWVSCHPSCILCWLNLWMPPFMEASPSEPLGVFFSPQTANTSQLTCSVRPLRTLSWFPFCCCDNCCYDQVPRQKQLRGLQFQSTAHHDREKWQWQGLQRAEHIISTVKSRERWIHACKSSAHTLYSYITQDPQPREWCHPQLRLVFLC